jgi:hypothetical protein
MNTELMAAWNDSSVYGPKWEDLPIVEQHRLEAFVDAVAEDYQDTIKEMADELSGYESALDVAKETLERLNREARADKVT